MLYAHKASISHYINKDFDASNMYELPFSVFPGPSYIESSTILSDTQMFVLFLYNTEAVNEKTGH